MEYLVIIIDNKGVVEPKKYACLMSKYTKDEAIKLAKKLYEEKYKNKDYESYTFTH